MKKGTWVKFNFNGSSYTGIIFKGGKTVEVNYKNEKGEYVSVKGPEAAFTFTEEPKMDTSTAMDQYSVSGYKEAGGDETIRFQCNLLKNGKKIATVSNDGQGGCNDYQGATSKDIHQFMEDSKLWNDDHGYNLYEPHDTWISWMTVAKPLGLTADDYLK